MWSSSTRAVPCRTLGSGTSLVHLPRVAVRYLRLRRQWHLDLLHRGRRAPHLGTREELLQRVAGEAEIWICLADIDRRELRPAVQHHSYGQPESASSRTTALRILSAAGRIPATPRTRNSRCRRAQNSLRQRNRGAASAARQESHSYPRPTSCHAQLSCAFCHITDPDRSSSCSVSVAATPTASVEAVDRIPCRALRRGTSALGMSARPSASDDGIEASSRSRSFNSSLRPAMRQDEESSAVSAGRISKRSPTRP